MPRRGHPLRPLLVTGLPGVGNARLLLDLDLPLCPAQLILLDEVGKMEGRWNQGRGVD